MTQTIGIESFGGHDPAVETWEAALKASELREALSGLLDVASEKAKCIISGAGHAALDFISEPAA